MAAWNTWFDMLEERRQRREVAEGMLLRMTNLTLSRAFNAFQENVHRQHRCRAALAHFRNACVARAFTIWLERVLEGGHAQELYQRAANFFRDRRLMEAWEQWRAGMSMGAAERMATSAFANRYGSPDNIS